MPPSSYYTTRDGWSKKKSPSLGGFFPQGPLTYSQSIGYGSPDAHREIRRTVHNANFKTPAGETSSRKIAHPTFRGGRGKGAALVGRNQRRLRGLKECVSLLRFSPHVDGRNTSRVASVPALCSRNDKRREKSEPFGLRWDQSKIGLRARGWSCYRRGSDGAARRMRSSRRSRRNLPFDRDGVCDNILHTRSRHGQFPSPDPLAIPNA